MKIGPPAKAKLGPNSGRLGSITARTVTATFTRFMFEYELLLEGPARGSTFVAYLMPSAKDDEDQQCQLVDILGDRCALTLLLLSMDDKH